MALPPHVLFGLGLPLANIVGGTPSEAFPGSVAIGAVRGDTGAVYCSGTVVAPNWVVTSAHCVLDGELFTEAGWTLFVFEGADIVGRGPFASSRWRKTVIPETYPTLGHDADVGLIELETPIGTPVDLLRTDMDQSWVGRDISYVSYGWTSLAAQDPGRKRRVDVPIDSISDGQLLTYAQSRNICPGDSGGSAYAVDEDGALRLAAVSLFILPGRACRGSRGGALRLDRWRSWIRRRVGAWSEPDAGVGLDRTPSGWPEVGVPDLGADAGITGGPPGRGCRAANVALGGGFWALVVLAAQLLARRRRTVWRIPPFR